MSTISTSKGPVDCTDIFRDQINKEEKQMNRFESVTDGTASHSSWLPNDGNQVAGYKPLRWLMALLLVAFVAGCGNGGGGRDPILGGSASVLQGLVSIKVTPATASIPVSGTQQYTATGTYNDGSSKDVTASSIWTAADVAPAVGVATILPSGVATGKVIGLSTITATLGGKSNSATLTVSSATVVSIMVTPATASIPVTLTQQYTALAILSDGLSIDQTANPLTTWTAVNVPSGGAAVATLSPSGAGAGLATGQVIGKSAITAAFGGKTSPALGAILTVIAGTTPGPAGAAPDLGTAAPYGIIASNAITGSPATHIFGDVALTLGTHTSVVGLFDSGTLPNERSKEVTDSTNATPGLINTTDNGNSAALPQLQIDLAAAYNKNKCGSPTRVPAGVALTVPLTVPPAEPNGGIFRTGVVDLGGMVLGPGTYAVFTCGSDTYALSTPLVLDAQGNADAVFVFQAHDITTTTGDVVLINGAQAKNVFWVMTATATIGVGTFFQGTIVTGNALTVNTGASVQGRMLAAATGAGALTVSGAVITVPK
jgi:trimeric autotransporter adhesin